MGDAADDLARGGWCWKHVATEGIGPMSGRSRRSERQEERREFGVGGTAYRYQMRQKVLSFGDDYWIENADGDRVFRIDGKALRLRDTLDFEDTHGRRLCRIQTRVLHIRDTMAVEDPDGETMATVHKKLISPLREKWTVDVEHGDNLDIHGNLVDHDARWPRCPNGGSGFGTPTACRSPRTWMPSWSLLRLWPSTR
jgi:uncharacterized protein YxjI